MYDFTTLGAIVFILSEKASKRWLNSDKELIYLSTVS